MSGEALQVDAARMRLTFGTTSSSVIDKWAICGVWSCAVLGMAHLLANYGGDGQGPPVSINSPRRAQLR